MDSNHRLTDFQSDALPTELQHLFENEMRNYEKFCNKQVEITEPNTEMEFLPQIVFLTVLSGAGYLLYQRISTIRSNILLGKSELRRDQPIKRLKIMLLVAFGQKKMFKKPIPAFLHLMIYVGFLVINLEVLEFIIDGLLGTHRVFAPYLGAYYNLLMNAFELLAVAVLFSCMVFLIRRNIIKTPRFHQSEMKGWPQLDGNLILILEIVLMIAILKMNVADQVLQSRGVLNYHQTGHLFFSGLFIPFFEPFDSQFLMWVERAAWWFHIIGILAFAIYVTYSKHLHIFMAFPNTYYSNLDPKGKMENMPIVMNEVKSMLGIVTDQASAPPENFRFGAKDVTDLSRKNLMDAYSCTECGRCTAACPANLTGKKLSPRKIMMDTRDRLEELGNRKKNSHDISLEKSLLGDYITQEEINACTSCNACVEECPININPLSIILEMRRYMAMEESSSPASWNAMFSNVETNFAPWKFPVSDRFVWASELKNEKS